MLNELVKMLECLSDRVYPSVDRKTVQCLVPVEPNHWLIPSAPATCRSSWQNQRNLILNGLVPRAMFDWY